MKARLGSSRELMLEHLAVLPRGGLCNRLRAIASAKRLCSRFGARCTVVWDWGEYDSLFDDDTDWIPFTQEMERQPTVLIPGFVHIRHLSQDEGGNYRNRRVPVTTHARISLETLYVFSAEGEPALKGYERDVLPWFPKPHPSILARVKSFREAHMPPQTAGLHMRRTDHEPAARRSPDEAYWREADRLVSQGYHLFLGTDNPETLRMMKERYGSRILSSPKRAPEQKRWPRRAAQVDDIAEDMVDLWLLASCDFVIGSACSSFSRVAMLFNGSPRCKAIDRPLPRLRSWLEQGWQRLHR